MCIYIYTPCILYTLNPKPLYTLYNYILPETLAQSSFHCRPRASGSLELLKAMGLEAEFRGFWGLGV